MLKSTKKANVKANAVLTNECESQNNTFCLCLFNFSRCMVGGQGAWQSNIQTDMDRWLGGSNNMCLKKVRFKLRWESLVDRWDRWLKQQKVETFWGGWGRGHQGTRVLLPQRREGKQSSSYATHHHHPPLIESPLNLHHLFVCLIFLNYLQHHSMFDWFSSWPWLRKFPTSAASKPLTGYHFTLPVHNPHCENYNANENLCGICKPKYLEQDLKQRLIDKRILG